MQSNRSVHGKRKSLKKLGMAGSALTVLVSDWKTPIVNTIVLPAHAMTSELPVISDIRCEPSTPSLEVGTELMISATINPPDGNFESVSWYYGIGASPYTDGGTGQFEPFNYTISDFDVGIFNIWLMVEIENVGNYNVTLCSDKVPIPNPANGTCGVDQIPGDWSIAELDFNSNFELFADGSGSDFSGRGFNWTLEGDNLRIEQTEFVGPTLFEGPYVFTLEQGCKRGHDLEKTATSIFKSN